MCRCVWLLSQNSPALFQRQTVKSASNTSALLHLRGSALTSNCSTSIFSPSIFEDVVKMLTDVSSLWCLVWFGCVVCDPSHLLGSLWALFSLTLSSVLLLSVQQFFSLSRKESDSPPRETGKRRTCWSSRSKRAPDRCVLHLCKMFSEIFKGAVCVCVFLLFYIKNASGTHESEWWKQINCCKQRLRGTLLKNSIKIGLLYNKDYFNTPATS